MADGADQGSRQVGLRVVAPQGLAEGDVRHLAVLGALHGPPAVVVGEDMASDLLRVPGDVAGAVGDLQQTNQTRSQGSEAATQYLEVGAEDPGDAVGVDAHELLRVHGAQADVAVRSRALPAEDPADLGDVAPHIVGQEPPAGTVRHVLVDTGADMSHALLRSRQRVRKAPHDLLPKNQPRANQALRRQQDTDSRRQPWPADTNTEDRLIRNKEPVPQPGSPPPREGRMAGAVTSLEPAGPCCLGCPWCPWRPSCPCRRPESSRGPGLGQGPLQTESGGAAPKE